MAPVNRSLAGLREAGRQLGLKSAVIPFTVIVCVLLVLRCILQALIIEANAAQQRDAPPAGDGDAATRAGVSPAAHIMHASASASASACACACIM
jgi:hypothetical protein